MADGTVMQPAPLAGGQIITLPNGMSGVAIGQQTQLAPGAVQTTPVITTMSPATTSTSTAATSVASPAAAAAVAAPSASTTAVPGQPGGNIIMMVPGAGNNTIITH